MKIEAGGVGVFVGAISEFVLALACALIFCVIKTVHIRIFKRYNFLEFLATLFFGIVYIVLQLILNNGIFRLYMLMAYSIGYIIGIKVFDKLLKNKFNTVLNLFSSILNRCKEVLMLPAKIVKKGVKKEK